MDVGSGMKRLSPDSLLAGAVERVWTLLASIVLLSMIALQSAPSVQASVELARSKFCMNCHGFGGTIVGPGYRAIAARRASEAGPEQEAQQQLAEQIAKRIRDGSQGQWGQTAMPANAVSAEEALQLARWILSLAPAVAESNGRSQPER